jgi:hypothetical protein
VFRQCFGQGNPVRRIRVGLVKPEPHEAPAHVRSPRRAPYDRLRRSEYASGRPPRAASEGWTRAPNPAARNRVGARRRRRVAADRRERGGGRRTGGGQGGGRTTGTASTCSSASPARRTTVGSPLRRSPCDAVSRCGCPRGRSGARFPATWDARAAPRRTAARRPNDPGCRTWRSFARRFPMFREAAGRTRPRCAVRSPPWTDCVLARVSPGTTEMWVPPRIQRMPGEGGCFVANALDPAPPPH